MVKETLDVISQQGNIFNVLNCVSLTIETENLDFTKKSTPKGKHPKRRKIDIAKAKDAKIFDILKYTLSENNMLYDGNIMAEADKSKIVARRSIYQILKNLGNNAEFDITCTVIDFMSVGRSFSERCNAATFKELLDNTFIGHCETLTISL